MKRIITLSRLYYYVALCLLVQRRREISSSATAAAAAWISTTCSNKVRQHRKETTCFSYLSTITTRHHGRLQRRRRRSLIHQSSTTHLHVGEKDEIDDNRIGSSSYLSRVLHEYGYGSRILTISEENKNLLPMLAEVYIQGETMLALAQRFIPSNSKNNKRNQQHPPRVELLLLEKNETVIVDIGQITTLWVGNNGGGNSISAEAAFDKQWRKLQTLLSSNNDKLHEQANRLLNNNNNSDNKSLDRALDRIYTSRVHMSGQWRRSTSLTKKIIAQLVTSHDERDYNYLDSREVDTMQQILRKVQKTGPAYKRLVDSAILCDYLYNNNNKDDDDSSSSSSPRRQSEQDALKAIFQQAVSCYILSRDASQGGRFKRWPCTLISHHSNDDDNNEDESSSSAGSSSSVTLINGGWTVLDTSVRAGTEARKFVERSQSTTTTSSSTTRSSQKATMTAADERIIRRLECLAMGEIFRRDGAGNDDDDDAKELELDVREALTAMELEQTPAGAKKALIRIGRWSSGYDDKHISSYIQPWSKETLQAAAWYAQQRQNHQQPLLDELDTKSKVVDLTQLPCVTVDAKTTTFRDDAIGVRARASTGRQVDPEASKWEILIHICDVSDIYSNGNIHRHDELFELRKAAQSRGMSRYDLPLGPLHLLPPVALDALALQGASATGTNRCVTFWAYIDERDGRLLDSGVERTIVSPPIALSYKHASNLMAREKTNGSASDEKAKAILCVAERNIQLWSQNRQRNSEAARKKEARRVARERDGKEQVPFAPDSSGMMEKDDGSKGFQRTRGHQLVDASLDLYAYGVTRLLRKARAPIPISAGADLSSGGRVATGPLRRYIDGEAQRQILAVLCNYGTPMTLEDCKKAAGLANEARNALSNIRAVRSTNKG